jgi:hypothetical protein
LAGVWIVHISSIIVGGDDEAVLDIETAAGYLADLMRAGHGGIWNIDINHNTCFVVVARNLPLKPGRTGAQARPFRP